MPQYTLGLILSKCVKKQSTNSPIEFELYVFVREGQWQEKDFIFALPLRGSDKASLAGILEYPTLETSDVKVCIVSKIKAFYD